MGTTTGRRKDSKDYLRVDLKPAGGPDLKSYVVAQADTESKCQGKTISATRYIQILIERDMQAGKGKKDRRQVIADMLAKVEDKNLPALETIVRALCK